MWSRASTDMARWQTSVLGPTARAFTVGLIALAFLSACDSLPFIRSDHPAEPVQVPSGSAEPEQAEQADAGSASGAGGAARPGAAGPTSPAPGSASGSRSGQFPSGSAVPVAVPARAKADFDRAVGVMRAGNATEAELQFKQLTVQYPQLAAPYVNLGILYRKAGHLDEAEKALKSAVEHNDASAVAWTELGATQRLRGEFRQAADSYERAINADPNFAPAYRNLGVVADLYLGDPERALEALERYKDLTGEDKPVSGWIAELRQRTGKAPAKPPGAPQPAAPAAAPSGQPGQRPAEPAAQAARPAKAGE